MTPPKTIQLRRVTTAINDGTHGSFERVPDGVPLLSAKNVVGGHVFLSNEESRISQEDFLLIDRTGYLRTGDVLLTIVGTIGRTAIFDCAEPVAFQRSVASLRPSRDTDGRYLRYVLDSTFFQSQLTSATRQSAQGGVYLGDLAEARIPIVPVARQRAIADYLDAETAHIDALIEKKRRMVELVEVRFWTAFTASVLRDEAPQTQLRRAIVFITDGPFGSAFSSADYSEDGAAVVRLGNIGFAEYRSEEQAFIPLDLYRSFLRHRVHAGDLLIAGLGDSANHAGRACVAPDLGPAMVKGKCFCARMHPDVAVSEYLALLLSSPFGAESIGVSGRGSTRTMINLDVVKSTVVPLPIVARQREIVAEAQHERRRLRVLIAALKNQIDLLAEHRQALITAAVTGELGIPGVAA
jgi:type I restriction enzyme S subunit